MDRLATFGSKVLAICGLLARFDPPTPYSPGMRVNQLENKCQVTTRSYLTIFIFEAGNKYDENL
jgi:hypothetical protein